MNTKYLTLVLVVGLFSACGNSGKSAKKIDISEYLPSEDASKEYLTVKKDKDGVESRRTERELVKLTANTVAIKIDNKLNRDFEIQEEKIIKKVYDNNKTQTIAMNRSISIGSTFYTIENTIKDEPIIVNNIEVGTKSIESKEVCKLKAELDTFSLSAIPYKDDILEFECLKKESVDTKIKEEWEGKLQGYASGSIELDYDLSYFYLKKGIGLIVEKDDNCYVLKDGISQIDDNAKSCKSETFDYKLFL